MMRTRRIPAAKSQQLNKAVVAQLLATKALYSVTQLASCMLHLFTALATPEQAHHLPNDTSLLITPQY